MSDDPINEIIRKANETSQKICELVQNLIEENQQLKAELSSLREWQNWPPMQEGHQYIKFKDHAGEHIMFLWIREQYLQKPLSDQNGAIEYLAYCGPFKAPEVAR